MRRPDLLNHATFIWNAADILRGTYKQHQYGDVILPFTVLARLDAVLAPTKAAVLAATAGYGLDDEIPQAMLRAMAPLTRVLMTTSFRTAAPPLNTPSCQFSSVTPSRKSTPRPEKTP